MRLRNVPKSLSATAEDQGAPAGVKDGVLHENEYHLPINDYETGSPHESTKISFTLRLVPKQVGFSFWMERVYEYERWNLSCEDL